MSFAVIKAQARRAVHSAFAVPVLFYPRGGRLATVLEKPLTARVHNKVVTAADVFGGGSAQIYDGQTHVVFDREELLAAGIAPKQGDVVEFLDYGFSLRLDILNDVSATGPITEKWTAGPAQ